MNCLSLAATGGYGPPTLSQYIIFCTDCRQSISRHVQTNIQKLCCKAAQEESQYQRESLANFWDQRKQPTSLHPLHGVSLAPWEQTVAGLQRGALPSLKTNISALLTTAMCPKKISSSPVTLLGPVSDVASAHNPITRLMFISPALQKLQRKSHYSPAQSLAAIHYPYVKTVSYCPPFYYCSLSPCSLVLFPVEVERKGLICFLCNYRSNHISSHFSLMDWKSQVLQACRPVH